MNIFTFAFTLTILTVLLTSNFTTAAASSISSNTPTLPTFLEKLLESALTDASPATLSEVRNIWLHQLALKQERIESTKGAVLNFQPSEQSYQDSGTPSAGYMSQFIAPEEEFDGGQVTNPTYIEGFQDYNYVRFLTPYFDPPYTQSGASIKGQMNLHVTGDVYVPAKLGPTGAEQNGNYLIVYGSNNPDASLQEWVYGFIGCEEVTYPNGWYNAPYVYIGYTSNVYKYMSIGCVNMGGSCTYNDVLADAIWATHGYNTLTVSSACHSGYTSLWGIQYVDPGSEVEITATPCSEDYVFDHWMLNETSYTENPITVTVDDDYILQAYFTCVGTPHQWLTIDAYSDYFGAAHPYVWIDEQNVGTAPVQVFISEGWHDITLENPYTYGYSWYLTGFSDNLENGASRSIYSETSITGYYNSW